jgi:hypothetical protein
MKKIFTTVFLLFIVFFVFSNNGWRKKEMEVKVRYNRPEMVEKFIALQLNGDYYADHAILYLIPDELDKIRKLGLDYIILKEDLNEYYKDFWNIRAQYHSYQEIVDLADSLAANFPDICMKIVYDSSYGYRELGVLKISDNVTVDEPEPEVMFDGGIHGDEIGAAENVIRFARDLCIEYGSDPQVTDLIDTREIWLYYMVNPDGRENMSRYNNNGVDLNRDWGYMWDGWGSSTGAYSQVESKALHKCAYNNQFVVHTTYHSGTEYISCPWSYRPSTPPDSEHILQLAGVYSSTSGYVNLTYGQGCTGMYPINGSTKDGNYGAMGSISWSMEISYDKQPPASQLMHYYNINKPSMLAMIEYSGYGLEGTVTDANTGDSLQAIVFVNDYLQNYTDSTAGDYHKYVLPGTYTIKVVANGYESQTITDVEVQEFTSTITDFQLVPEDTARQYVYKIVSCQIPGNNTADEGNTLAVFGPPDNINYSIGKDGWIVVDMQKFILDRPGPDIKVFEGDFTPEEFDIYVCETMYGPWTFLGTGEGTTEFELSSTGFSEVRFLKIEDDGDGPALAPDAGFDLDAVSDMEHSWGVYIVLFDYYIDDSSGNGNGLIDPGETVDLIVTIGNTGNVNADNTIGTLSTTSQYITINQPVYSFGTILQGQNATGIFNFTADPDTPPAEPVLFTLDITAIGGIYSTSFNMEFFVGQLPVLIIDLDANHNSGPIMASVIQNLDVTVDITATFPNNINIYKCIFVCLGTYAQNHTLSANEGQLLADYLNHAGNIYMEGGDTWYYNPQTAVHPMFNINGLSDGSGDLGMIFGQDGTFAEGMIFQYSGDNSFIDRIEPSSEDAFELFRNQVPSYCNSVANNTGDYKTIGSSFEFGGLDDGQSTKEELMIEILNFFGGILTNMPEHDNVLSENISVYPNPFNNITNIHFTTNKSKKINIGIYDLHGRLIKQICDKYLESGKHNFVWDGKNESNLRLPDGIYYYRISDQDYFASGKIVLMK